MVSLESISCCFAFEDIRPARARHCGIMFDEALSVERWSTTQQTSAVGNSEEQTTIKRRNNVKQVKKQRRQSKIKYPKTSHVRVRHASTVWCQTATKKRNRNYIAVALLDYKICTMMWASSNQNYNQWRKPLICDRETIHQHSTAPNLSVGFIFGDGIHAKAWLFSQGAVVCYLETESLDLHKIQSKIIYI